jgi:c-di-GMP-binding flagellar brake protein YcgR
LAPMHAGLERRKYRRVAVEIDVEIEQIDDHGLVGGVSLDVSLGGVKVRSPLGRTTDGAVVVVLSTEDRMFVAIGRIVETTVLLDTGEVEMRVEFDRVSAATRERLSQFLAAHPG